ncbi:MAG: hypothetical protein PHY64_08495, partial [Eubacteriales bacterium]|nr:hypothetical protein [Eubacteriales bacterium]
AYAKACSTILKTVHEPVELENYVRQLSFESGFTREVLLEQIGVSPQRKRVFTPKRESFHQKAKDASMVDMTACTLLAVLATGRLPKGAVTADEFTDPSLQAICEALLAGESAAALMENQPDEQGRAAIGAILNIQTDSEDAALMKMAQDCLKRMRRTRLEAELEEIQRTLPNLPEGERPAQTERAMRVLGQLQSLDNR